MATKASIYELLEAKLPLYSDLANITVLDNDEPLVAIPTTKHLAAKHIDLAMKHYTQEKLYVRKSVADKLQTAANFVAKVNPNFSLLVVYGFRPLEIQQKLHDQIKASLKHLDPEQLTEKANRYVAASDTAGHPAGAAVDVDLLYKGRPVDMGTTIHDLSPDSHVFSPYVSKTAWQNRSLLRNAMVKAGFAPFDGEWWHFSYGDREWAFYCHQPNALYKQITSKELEKFL